MCQRREIRPRHIVRAVSLSTNHTQQDGPEQQPERLKVISCLAACVEADAIVASFETIAGRSAMVGFAIAFCSELLLPKGLFGAWKVDYNLIFYTALSLVCSAAVLATMSKRRLGKPFREAVLTSLTALSRSAGSITNRNVDGAVDYVFEQVFAKSFLDAHLIDIDDFI